MERDVWKWLFSDMSDIGIVQLLKNINKPLTSRSRIKINGISDFSKIRPEQIRLFRNLIETELNKSKNLFRVKSFFKVYYEQSEKKETFTALADKDADTIWEELNELTEPSMQHVIGYFIIQADEEQINKGIQLYVRHLNKNVKNENPSRNKPINENTALSEEIERLMVENKKLQEENKETIRVNKELKKMNSQTQSLKNDLIKANQKFERELELKKTEIASRIRKAQELQEELEQLQKVESRIRSEQERFQNQVKDLEEKNSELEENLKKIMQEKQASKRKITIIDRTLPKWISTLESIHIELITPNEMEQEIHTDMLNSSEEIWFMNFRLSIPKQSVLNEKYGSKVRGFSNYIDLKEHCNLY